MADNKTEATPPADTASANGNRFFGWMRSLGLQRTDGWIGGVCAGLGARLGIDPIIIRGIAVVAAVLGAPVFLFYAAAWALLPDRNDRIHAERLAHGEFDPAMVGIGVLALLTFLPFTQGVWWAGSQFWGAPVWPEAVGRSLWTLVVIGLIVAFVIWAARGAHWPPRGGSSTYGSRTASANSAAPGYGSAADPGAGPAPAAPAAPAAAAAAAAAADTVASTATVAAATTATAADATEAPASASPATDSTIEPQLDVSTEPTEPPAPPAGASTADLDAWKVRQAAWRVEYAAWQARRDADLRAVRAQRSAENRARAREFAQQAEQRRLENRRANPRTSAAFVFATIGLALVGAAVAAIVAQNVAVYAGYEVTAALAVATLVFAVAGILAGALRRRSGFLGFLSIVFVIATLVSAFVPRDRQLILQPTGTANLAPTASASFFQPLGDTNLTLTPAISAGSATPVIDLVKGPGGTFIDVDATTTVRLEVDLRGGILWTEDGDTTATTPDCVRASDGTCHYDVIDGPKTSPDVIVRIEQAGGDVQLLRSTETTGDQG